MERSFSSTCVRHSKLPYRNRRCSGLMPAELTAVTYRVGFGKTPRETVGKRH